MFFKEIHTLNTNLNNNNKFVNTLVELGRPSTLHYKLIRKHELFSFLNLLQNFCIFCLLAKYFLTVLDGGSWLPYTKTTVHRRQHHTETSIQRFSRTNCNVLQVNEVICCKCVALLAGKTLCI